MLENLPKKENPNPEKKLDEPKLEEHKTDEKTLKSSQNTREKEESPKPFNLNSKNSSNVLEFETMKLPKIYTPYTYIMYSNKLAEAKERFKESLKEVGVELTEQERKWAENMKKGEEILKKSVSVKYLGVKDGQIGILSKRVPISEEKPTKSHKPIEKSIDSFDKREYLVNKYSLPHQLKTVFKPKEEKKQQPNLFLGDFSLEKSRNQRKIRNQSENIKEAEIKRKIKLMIEKKKEALHDKIQLKQKNSQNAWELLISSPQSAEHKNQGFSYSSLIKNLKAENKEKLHTELEGLIKRAFYRK